MTNILNAMRKRMRLNYIIMRVNVYIFVKKFFVNFILG